MQHYIRRNPKSLEFEENTRDNLINRNLSDLLHENQETFTKSQIQSVGIQIQSFLNAAFRQDSYNSDTYPGKFLII